MNCGTVLHDNNYQFTNGVFGDKLVIIICECGTDHLALVTTSKAHSKNSQPGCQITDKPPNFFLRGKTTWFDLDTWIELQEVYELTAQILAQKKDSLSEYKDALPMSLMKDILDCALQSQFIDEYYLDFLRRQRAKLDS